MLYKNAVLYVITTLFLLTACSFPREVLQNTRDPVAQGSAVGEIFDTAVVIPESTPPDGFADYDAILEEYRRYAVYALAYMDEELFTDDFLHYRGWLWGLILDFHLGREWTKDDFSYAITDLNGNGNPELILAMGEQVVRAIFSMVDDKPKLLDEFWARNYCEINSSMTLYVRSSSGADYSTFATYRLSEDDRELVLIDEFGTEGADYITMETIYYKMEAGNKESIRFDEFEVLYERFSDVSHATKNSGIKFTQLF